MGVYERMFGEDRSSCGKVLEDEERVEGDKKVRKRERTTMSQI